MQLFRQLRIVVVKELLGFFPTECTNGTYGNGCQQRCGHCKDLKQCHHVNGTCLDGCGPGYDGEFCSLGMVN